MKPGQQYFTAFIIFLCFRKIFWKQKHYGKKFYLKTTLNTFYFLNSMSSVIPLITHSFSQSLSLYTCIGDMAKWYSPNVHDNYSLWWGLKSVHIGLYMCVYVYFLLCTFLYYLIYFSVIIYQFCNIKVIKLLF